LPPILILGAGPAGCAAATLLAGWGHEVVVFARPVDERRALAESIPHSANRVLAALGMLAAVQEAAFHPWTGNAVWWGGEARAETFAAGASGYQVHRGVFDRCLRRLALDAGAVIRDGFVRDADLSPPSPAVVVEVEGRRERVTGSFVLDCSGRAGVIARSGPRRRASRQRTIAITGVWEAARWTDAAWEGHTWVASYGDGWAWSVPIDPRVRYVTVMIDPGHTELLRGASSRDVYLRELSKARPFTAALDRAWLRQGPWGADASAYDAHRYAGEQFLLVGDAGSFIDPLSSFGVKKALASGWLAAIVAHTALSQPGMRAHALAFFDRRERDVFAASARQAAVFASAAAGHTDTAFWLARAASPEDEPPLGDVDVAALARDEVVLAAFADLRARPVVRLRRGAVEVAPRPAVRGREIVLEEHLLLPETPHGVRFVRGVDVVTLLKLAPTFNDVGDICQAAAGQAPSGVTIPDVLGALSWLVARGALLHEETAAP
jgi:flavin-dependent dehydrogenase